jgi:glutaminyl-peptide cyclotransferase
MKYRLAFLLLTVATFAISCSNNSNNNPETSENTSQPASNVPTLTYSIAGSFPHDSSYFTEGIEFFNNTLLESTGNYGFSKLVQTDLKTGKVLKEVKLDSTQFGEGITQFHDTIYQLTYKEHIVNVYSGRNFNKVKQLPLNTEGWGLTHDSTSLIASDGSSNLYYYEPGTFKLLRTQGVLENGMPPVNINELEYINGYIYSNQWEYNYILKIDPKSGNVVAKLDLTNLVNQEKAKNPKADVLNGIAYNPLTNKIYITGKYWTSIYEIQFQH